MADSIIDMSMLKCGALLYSGCDLKTAQMNMQRTRIPERIFHEFELGYNAAEATKVIYHIYQPLSSDRIWHKDNFLSRV